MRIVHVGNIANNGYINAKLLRRAGVDADVIFDERHVLSRPEWEDAPLDGSYAYYQPLEDEAARAGWTPPDWAHPARDLRTVGRFKGDLPIRASRSAARRYRETHRRLSRLYAPLVPELGPLTRSDVGRALFAAWYFEASVGSLSRHASEYDAMQAYATHPIFPLLLTPQWPYVAFEHGTMREIPFEDTWRGRMLALAYRQAAKVIITNADVVEQAHRLGLENYVFIPHPLDETKYTPGPSELRDVLEAEGFDFVLLCPSRHDWDIKGLDRLLRAFAEFVGTSVRRTVLVLFDWGAEVERSRALIEELGIGQNVRWSAPLPKLRLIDAYRAADVVLDQFLIGTFGAVAPEAMSCGRPVVMAFDPAVHEWCFTELPPIIDARTPEDIFRALTRLADNEEERGRLGARGRDWVKRNHGWRLVTDRQREIYEEILEKR
jgi:glycosyltransferase involved in cell wall biosynthesis